MVMNLAQLGAPKVHHACMPCQVPLPWSSLFLLYGLRGWSHIIYIYIAASFVWLGADSHCPGSYVDGQSPDN